MISSDFFKDISTVTDSQSRVVGERQRDATRIEHGRSAVVKTGIEHARGHHTMLRSQLTPRGIVGVTRDASVSEGNHNGQM